MKYVELDRRFVSLSDTKDIDPELWASVSRADGRLSWDRLLQRKRVVILAEAGSGKSTELAERCKLWKATGNAAFSATLQSVARSGLQTAIGAKVSAEFAAWQASNARAWFFIDSVDEAKLDNVRLEDALQKIADVLDHHLSRVHIVLSGRHTDWEFRRDVERLEDILPVPVEQPREMLSEQAQLDEVIHNQAPKRNSEGATKQEATAVVVMVGLNEAQICLFAAAAGVTDLDAFAQALKQAELLEFAKRPLDLEWLAQSWKRQRRFGTFAQMLDQAIVERSKETDPLRAQQAPLEAARVRSALCRIGAALVLARRKAIAIPDTSLGADPQDDAIELESVLPDWQPPDIQRLARLPVFDPGAPGRARLHNDNQGVVRGFLAAEWMCELRANNCPVQELFELLFADMYGHAFVRPSMCETAAWLSLWNDDVANEVIKRDPNVLLCFGDPGSLPRPVKERALERFATALAESDNQRVEYDLDALRRFTHTDLADAVRKAWRTHPGSRAVRAFLLRLIWLGEIKTCSDLAIEAVYETSASRQSMIFGGRALLAAASEVETACYAAHVMANVAALPLAVVWDAVGELFPAVLTVGDFIAIVDSIGGADNVSVLETEGPEWTKRLDKPDDLIALITALDAKLERPYGDIHGTGSDDDRHFLPMMVSAGHRILQLSGAHDAPNAAIDALLRVSDGSCGYDSEDSECAAFKAAMHQTKGRRRAAFWRAAHRLKNAKYLTDGLDMVWKMQHFGYEPGLVAEDIEWLLADAPRRQEDAERALGIDGALWVWRATGQSNELLQRVRTAAGADAALNAVVNGWTVPREPSSELVASERLLEERKLESKKQRDTVSQSWKKFVDNLRADPDQLRNLRPVTEDTIDWRLHAVWQLLNSSDRGLSCYSFETTDALKPLLGADAAEAVAGALIDFWRKWTPGVRSGRPADKRDVMFSFDSMGIAGVAMEAHRSSDWPAMLTEAEALRAAQYATLELNGFPSYLTRLAGRFPSAVRDALMAEIRSELDNPRERGGTLESIAYAGEAIAKVLAESLEGELRARTDVGGRHLNTLLEALAPAVPPEREEALTTLLLERFQRPGAPRDEQVEYLGAAFELDPKRAAVAMLAEAGKTQQPERSEFLQQTMAVYFGRSHLRRREPARAPFEMLEELIRAAYGAIDPAHDVVHKGVYRGGLRDDAESARGHLVEMLVKTPGRGTYETLRRLNGDPNFNSLPGRFEELAIGRAAEDSEHEPWDAAAVVHFESMFDDTPRTGADLRLLTRRRLEDIKHTLTEGDFAQASTLRLLPGETEVQNFVAQRLRDAQGRAYSIEREAHVVDEKKPDIRVRARATDATVSVEIKDTKSWSLKDLEDALRDQLCGQYLRDKSHRHGILLLVHREKRLHGWLATDGSYWLLDQVVAHLQKIATEIASTGPDAPDAEIVVIGVAQ